MRIRKSEKSNDFKETTEVVGMIATAAGLVCGRAELTQMQMEE